MVPFFMMTFRLLLLTGYGALALFARPALAQDTTRFSKAPGTAGCPPKYNYTFLWGLWSNQAKRGTGPQILKPSTNVNFAAGSQQFRPAAKADSAYQTHRILGGAVQWTEKRSTLTR
ncbi:hypothetical protein IC235_18540 [Hymenobacter sp. BT664]|uniref:Uncharacterized protein n=1 Tax=Hymenobacter montanus TaxID=2771359 RepID=A0A927BH38_9BACT|nr:hypothetical protein [Hymenobacter montanus]MBD2769892.1 hypothetical protein [Hymenobacter montanus]